MKRFAQILALLSILLLTTLWCLLPFKVGGLTHSTPMSPENVILVSSDSGERVAEHLRGVSDYVSKLGPNLKIKSYTNEKRHSLSRFLPFPHSGGVPYRVLVEFSDEQERTYTAIFSGAIGFDARGLASPRYLNELARESIDGFIFTVFQASPAAIREGRFEKFPE